VTTPALKRREQREHLSIAARRWLIAEDFRSAWFYLTFRGSEEARRKFWREYSDMVVRWHARHWPGTRPRLWWRYDSPQPRRRVGGIGTPLHECTAYALLLHDGIPADWRRPGDGFSRGVPIDRRDPPRFESQASYLRRHGLLLPGERERLRPRDFWAEAIV
jgi:hypothetical protein